MRRFFVMSCMAMFALQGVADAKGFRHSRSRGTWHYELVQIKAGRGEFLKVLNYCRQKYPPVINMNAEFSGHYGQHGWFCAFRS